jgi:hypothetical protein
MLNLDTDLLFPPHILPALCDLRGVTWQKLVNLVIEASPGSIEQMAFILMMARMNNCATCNSDSYRAIKGCTFCSKQSLSRFHETDQALIDVFHTSVKEVKLYLYNK